MKTNTYFQYAFKNTFKASIISGLITSVFYAIIDDSQLIFIRIFCGFLVGLSVAMILMFNYTFINKKLSRHMFLLSLFINSLIVLFVVITVPTMYHMLFGVFSFKLTMNYMHTYLTSPGFVIGTGFGTIMTLIFTFVSEISLLIGPATLRKIITGRYHKAREEVVAVMFLDLNDSTAIAESLGEITFLSFVNDFFRDISEALIMTQAQIIKYVGDEAIIIWPDKKAVRDDNCYRCFLLAKKIIREKSPYYLKRYGRVPDFKAGLHYGPVVFGEVGLILKEIACLGDVLNTAARITSACREYRQPLLLSREIATKMSVFTSLSPVGEVQLRGKTQTTELYGLPANA